MRHDQSKIDVRLSEVKVQIAELKTEFRGFAQSLRRTVELLAEENRQNTTFRERAMGAIVVLGSTTVLGLVAVLVRVLLGRGLG